MVLLVGLSVALNLGTASFAGIPAGRRQFHVPAIGGLVGTGVEIAVVVATIGYLHLVALGAGFLASVLVSQGYCAWWIWKHEPWFRHLPRRIGWVDIRRVASFSAPLLVLSVSGQVISATDLVVVGAVATAAAVGLYRAGSVVPSQATFLLFTGYDTLYPHLAGTTDRVGQENATRFLTRVASFVAGAVFATVILLRVDVVVIVTGRASALGESVLVVFCCVWLANVPVHGLSLLLIARGRQNVFVWLVGVEAAANLVLTIVITVLIGPIGAAYATLVTIVVSNVIVFPHLVRHEFSEAAARRTALEALVAIAVGGASAALAASPAFEIGAGWGRLLVGLALGGGFSCALGLVLLRQRGRSVLASMLRDTRAT
jgi:O-antigen/teichoic acid export membrane protein